MKYKNKYGRPNQSDFTEAGITEAEYIKATELREAGDFYKVIRVKLNWTPRQLQGYRSLEGIRSHDTDPGKVAEGVKLFSAGGKMSDISKQLDLTRDEVVEVRAMSASQSPEAKQRYKNLMESFDRAFEKERSYLFTHYPPLRYLASRTTQEEKDEIYEAVLHCMTNPRGRDIPHDIEWSDKTLEYIDHFTPEIQETLEALGYEFRYQEETFAIPSHDVMFTIIALFAGKSSMPKIPRWIREKSKDQWTDREKARAKEISDLCFTSNTDPVSGDTRRYALLRDTPQIHATTEINQSLFSKDIDFMETDLAHKIQKAFGAEGMRHLLTLMIQLDEQGRSGFFEWDVNRHLNLMGYKKNHGAHSVRNKQNASSILRLFVSLGLVTRRRKGKTQLIEGDLLFTVEGFKYQLLDNVPINEKLKIRATDFWYKEAFSPSGNSSPQYTKLLKRIVKEPHRDNPLTLTLAPLLAVRWRISPDVTDHVKVRSLLEWCNLPTSGHKLNNSIKTLQAELEYMKHKGYLGHWAHNGNGPALVGCDTPLNTVVTLEPPAFIKEDVLLIKGKRDTYIPKNLPPVEPITQEEFIQAYEYSGLSKLQFAQTIGISRRNFYYIFNGERQVSRVVSEKVRDKYGHFL